MASPILRKGSIGYGACPDMTGARRLLQLSHSVENAGFEAIWVSDHFHPWFHTNASEYSTWVWMAAAMQEIKIPFGTSVTAPILRYHPAIAAQAFATMETLFGHRVMLGVGTGEAMNEVPLGFQWPKYSERRDRLIEAVQVMKKLWRGGFVDFHVRHGTEDGEAGGHVRGRDHHRFEDSGLRQGDHIPEPPRRRGRGE
jgi:coenzyme F420-dependent glucose-6-phosphate dehydrogenase